MAKSRQLESEKRRKIAELYFLVKWMEETTAFDVLGAKKIRTSDMDILEIDEGDRVEGEFHGKFFPAGVLAKGTYQEMKRLLDIRDVDDMDMSDTTNSQATGSDASHPPKESSDALKPQTKCASELYFCVHWEDEGELYDVVPAKNVDVGEVSHDEVMPGEVVKASHQDQWYTARVVAKGPFTEMNTVLQGILWKESDGTPRNKPRKNSPQLTPVKAKKGGDKVTPVKAKKSGDKVTPVKAKKSGDKGKKRKGNSSGYVSDSEGSEIESTPKRKKGRSGLKMGTPTKKDKVVEAAKETHKKLLQDKKKKEAAKSKSQQAVSSEILGLVGSNEIDDPEDAHYLTRVDTNPKVAADPPPPMDLLQWEGDTPPTSGGVKAQEVQQLPPSPQHEPIVYNSPHTMSPPMYPPYHPPWHFGPPTEMMNMQMIMLKSIADSLVELRKEVKRRKPRSVHTSDVPSDSDVERKSVTPMPQVSSGTEGDSGSGCILGDPNGQHVRIPGYKQVDVLARENSTLTAQKLALKLVSLFFSKETLSNAICTPQNEDSSAGSKDVLDQNIMEGIRLHVDYKYSDGTGKKRWQEILRAINSKCRCQSAKSKVKDMVTDSEAS